MDRVFEIREWLGEIFGIPRGCFEITHSDDNLYSDTLIFSNNVTNSNVPNVVFVKIFTSDTERSAEKYETEKKGLLKAATINSISHVQTPVLYGCNDEMHCIAMEFFQPDEDSLFHYLWNSRRNKLFLTELRENDLLMLRHLGRWLSLFHQQKICVSDELPKQIIASDLNAIKTRVELLSESKISGIPFMNNNLVQQAYRVAQTLAGGIAQSSEAFLVFGHGDFTLANIIRNSHNLCVIDFAMGGPSFAENDYARIMTDLCNIELAFLFSCKKDIGDLISVQAFFTELGAFEYSDTMRFYLIKQALINLTMYAKYYGNLGVREKMFFGSLMKCQLGLLQNIVA
jgi:tRNA A-37 threonylcarbamoyl transferase component Bud32